MGKKSDESERKYAGIEKWKGVKKKDKERQKVKRNENSKKDKNNEIKTQDHEIHWKERQKELEFWRKFFFIGLTSTLITLNLW